MAENLNLKSVETVDTRPFRKLVMTVGELPTSYIESMTYYELLTWLTNYLENTVIPTVNNNAEAVEELQDLFVELKTFVDDYFENLDVQEEINNKLDDMAEAGTLQEIITTYIQANVAWCFDTVADMQSSTNLVNGSYARTLGYNTINDKCGALYKITSESSDIQIGDDLYAHYVDDNAVYSIDDFDGETPEDKLFAALDTITLGTIVGGDITITKQYTASAKDYRNISIVDATLTLTIDHWFNQAAATYNTVPLFKDCTINGTGREFYNNTTKVTGIFFDGCDLNHVCLFNKTDQATSNFTQSPYIINCTLNGVENLITSHIAYDLKMINCRVESATGILLKYTEAGAIRQGVISNCLIEGRFNVVMQIGGAYGLVIENCYFEANKYGLLDQTAASGACFITVKDCTFFTPLDSTDYQIRLASNAYNNAAIYGNLSNMPSGKYLCDKPIRPINAVNMFNRNYVNNWENNGFAIDATNRYQDIAFEEKNATWNSDDSTWDFTFAFKYGGAYTVMHPMYIIFEGTYSGAAYVGYAIMRCCPRTCYTGGAVKTLCDVTLVDSCNKDNSTKTSDATVTAVVTNDSYSVSTCKITIKLSGFTSTQGKFRLIDPFALVGFNVVPKF